MTISESVSVKAGRIGALAAIATCWGAGCAGRGEQSAARDLALSDFRAEAAPAPQPPSAPESTIVLDQSLGFAPEHGPTGALEVVAAPGAPEAPESAEAIAARVIVDLKVGEINTRPVWAAEFLAPMAARMREWAEQLPPDEWRGEARDRIVLDLELRLNQELVRADTLASIPPANRPGLSHFIEDVLRRERSERRGSAAIVEGELREENRTMGDAWQDERDRQLIIMRQRQWLEQVHVSADEVELEYHRRFKEFNPDPRATFRRISVPAGAEEAIAAIQQRLEAGEPFAAVAEDPANRISPERGGLVEGVGSFSGEYAEADFWSASARELNEAARSLSEGEWTGPFPSGSSMNWLYLEGVERKTVSLYEASPQIRERLEDIRFNEIAMADFERMKSRASFTDIDVMADRLLRVAERWYLEPALARRADPGQPGVRPR